MLFVLIVKGSKNSKKGNSPKLELIDAMKKYNEDIVKAGIRVMAKGLHPSSERIRISYFEEGKSQSLQKGLLSNLKA